MRNYQLTLIFSPILSEQEANDQMQQLASLVQEKGGILGEQQMLGKRPLLAPIKSQKEGFLASLAFTVSPEYLGELEAQYKGNSQVLRSLLAQRVRKSARAGRVPQLKQKTSEVPQGQAETEGTQETQQQKEPRKEEKIDLKDID